MNSSDTTRPGRKPTEPAARLPHRARDGRPATLKITCTVTRDSPDGRPWPPTEGDVLWRLLRRADECSYWRAIEIRSAATDFIPRQQSQLKGSEHEDEVAIVIRRGHVRASHSTAGIQTEMKEV